MGYKGLEITESTRRPITDEIKEFAREDDWSEFEVERGYGYFNTDLFDHDDVLINSKHIQCIGIMDVFDSDMEAALYAEKFYGEKIFHYDVECGTWNQELRDMWFVDEPETRKAVEDYLERMFGPGHGLKPDYETESLFEKAVAHYFECAGVEDFEEADVTDNMISNEDVYVYCYLHNKDLIDLDFWCDYQELLGKKLSWDEYVAIDKCLDGAPADYTQEDTEIVDMLREKLEEYRDKNRGVKIEVGPLSYADDVKYIEGSVKVDGVSYPFDYNIENEVLEIHHYSEPGWFTGASYEKELPDVVTKHFDEIDSMVYSKVQEFLDKSKGVESLIADASERSVKLDSGDGCKDKEDFGYGE